MPGAVKNFTFGEATIGEDGALVYPEASSAASTPLSKATPMSKNIASPELTASWTNAQTRPHGGPSSAQPSQGRQLQHTQKAKKSFFATESPSGRDDDPEDYADEPLVQPVFVGRKGPFDTDSVRGQKSDAEDDDDNDMSLLQPTPTRISKALFDSESIRDRGDDQQDDDLDPSAPTSAQMPTKKGVLSFSSATTSVVDPAENTLPPQKISNNMRGKSALTTEPNPELKKPTERRKTARKSTGRAHLSALDLEGDDVVDQKYDETADPFHIANMPRSRGASPKSVKPKTRNVPKKQPAMKPSNPPTQDKKPLSKPIPSRKKPAKPRQKAKDSAAADNARETASTESSEDHQDDSNVVNTGAKVCQSKAAASLATKTKITVPTRAKVAEIQDSHANAESAHSPSGSEHTTTDVNENDENDDDDDEYVDESTPKSRAKTALASKKPPQTTKKAPPATKKRQQAKNIATGAKAPKEAAHVTKFKVTNKAKEKVGGDNGDSGEGSSKAASLPKKRAETSQSSVAPKKKAVVAKSPPAEKTSGIKASSASNGDITTRNTRSAPKEPSSEDNPGAGSLASRPAPRPTTRSQPKTQPTLGSEDSNDGQADTVSSGADPTKPGVKQAEDHERSQPRQAAGGPDGPKVAQDQGEPLVTSSKQTVQNTTNITGAPEAVKDRQRKGLTIPLGADGPKTNGKPQKKRPAGDDSLRVEGPSTSHESGSSSAAKAKLTSPTEDKCVESVDNSEVEIANVQRNTASHTRDSRTQGRSSRVEHIVSAVPESSKQQRTLGSRTSQRPVTEAPRRPSVIPEEDEEQDALLLSDAGCHQNTGAQTTVVGEALYEVAAVDDDGMQFGDEPPDALDRYGTSDAPDNLENTSDSASALPTHFMDHKKRSVTLTTDQVQGLRRLATGRFRDEGPVHNDQPKASHQFQSQFAKDLEPRRRALKRPSTDLEVMGEETTTDDLPSRHQDGGISLDFSDHQQPSMTHNSQSMTNKQPTYKRSRQPFMVDEIAFNQNQQPSAREMPRIDRNLQSSTVQPPTAHQQRLGIQRHTMASDPYLLEPPVWKRQSVMSQQTVPNQHFLVESGERTTGKVGPDWQASLERETTADELPMTKSFSQPGVGIQSARLHIQGLSSDFQRPPKRTRLNGPVPVAEPRLPTPANRPCIPAEGFSSDDVFAPKQANGPPQIDNGIVDRLRGVEDIKAKDARSGNVTGNVYQSGQLPRQSGAMDLGGEALRAAPSENTSPGSLQEESPEQLCGSDLWRQSLMNRRTQRTMVPTHDAKNAKNDELEMYEGVGDVLQKIVTVSLFLYRIILTELMHEQGVLRSLKTKEAAVHDVVIDYQMGGARIVDSIVATHVKERQQLIDEHEQNRLKYIRILEDARSKFRAIGEAAGAFDIDSVPFW